MLHFTKNKTRSFFKATIKKHLEQKSVEQYSQQICDQLLLLNIWKPNCVVACYWPLPMELSIAPFQKKIQKTCKFVFPKINNTTHKMIFVEARFDKKQDWQIGSYGINEPISNKAVPLNKIDIFLVPALAFDQDGRRLGRGKGFYDRILCQASGLKIGLAGVYQISYQDLPEEIHDIKMDAVLTNDFLIIPFRYSQKFFLHNRQIFNDSKKECS